MSTADLGLQVLANIPSFYYGTSPNKFFDYISAGLPVLNNYPGWISDLIGQHQCGFSVPPDDPEAFADALEFAAANSDALKIMGYNARKLAETQFDRNILSNAWVEWVTEE
jgi:glycosyltransferase involved in cell wall biosynthesis